MSQQEAAEKMRQQLLNLQAALFDLRDELLNMGDAFEQLAIDSDEPASQIARDETAALLARVSR